MRRTLILLRHGKSGYPPGVADHDRPLAPRGERQAALAGRWIREEWLSVDAVLCSTSRRTRETFAKTGIDAPTQFIDDLYGGSPSSILETIRVYAPESATTLLVVGHVPGMPATALQLDPDAEVAAFPTSAYAVLHVGVPWSEVGMTPDPQLALLGVRIPR